MKLVELFLLFAALFALEERDGIKSVIVRNKAGDDASTGNETHGNAFSTRSKGSRRPMHQSECDLQRVLPRGLLGYVRREQG